MVFLVIISRRFGIAGTYFKSNQGAVEVFYKILPGKAAALEETNYSPFVFLLGPIFGQSMSEIDCSTCATKSRFWSICFNSHS